MSQMSRGSDEYVRIPARNQDVLISDSHKKTIRRISFSGSADEVGGGG